MSTTQHGQVTRILAELRQGDPEAMRRLLPVVYDELHRLAHNKMRNEPRGLTLQTTDLVHEAWLRLVGDESPTAASWENRRHFFGAAAEAMRRILIERARRAGRHKHGGGKRRVPLEQAEITGEMAADLDLLALDEALRRLEGEDPVRSEVVKLRCFAGLTIDQTASAMDLSPATVKRHWTYAHAWLRVRMHGEDESSLDSSES
jgi:RNA polymerase sigma factor (TIGR02999 family)